MSFFIAGRKSDMSILESGSRSPDLAGDILTGMRAALCANYGTADADLSVLVLPDGDAQVAKIAAGWEYSVVWAAGEITGFDFTVETAKRIVYVTATKAAILADNTETLTIRVELWKPDNTGIATGVTTTADVPILTPGGRRKVRVSLVAGVATRVFKTAIPGEWRIPASNTRFGGVRIGSFAAFESIQTFDTL
jgi:hypothetical protein